MLSDTCAKKRAVSGNRCNFFSSVELLPRRFSRKVLERRGPEELDCRKRTTLFNFSR
jgi:hypothetical protein